MTDPARRAAAAVHIGADLLDGPQHAGWAKLLSCRDTAERLSRLSDAAGVRSQRRLLGADATIRRVRHAIADSAVGIGAGGLLVLSFSGHSERAVPGEHRGGWYLRDGALRHAETAELLAAASPSAHIVVVADTCYATAFASAVARVPAAMVLLAACGENQATLNYPVSEFITRLERLTFPNGAANPDCRSYAWLRNELRKDTPDVERPDVYANRTNALQQRPFQPTTCPDYL